MWEKKTLPCFQYLIQIFALHCRRTPLHYYHRRLPLAAYVVLIGQSVTERKPAGYRERACAAPSAATKKAHRLPRARTRRAIEVAAFGRRAAERPGGSRLAARRSRRAVLLHYRVPLGLHRYGVSTAAAPAPLRMPPPSSPPRRRRSSWLSFFLLSSTMWEESSLSINPHCTIEKGYGLTPTKMLKIWSIPKRDFTPNLYFYSSDCVELEIYSKNMTKCMVRIYQWMQSSPTSYMHNFITLHFFFKFVSLANNSKSYAPTKWPRKQKNVALEKFLVLTTLKLCDFWAG